MIVIKHKTDDMEFTITVYSGCSEARLTMEKQPRRAYRLSRDSFAFRGILFRSNHIVEVLSNTVYILGASQHSHNKTYTFSMGSPAELLDFVSRLYMGLVLIEETYKDCTTGEV